MGKFSRINESRICVVCGAEFIAKREFRKVCGKRCAGILGAAGWTESSRKQVSDAIKLARINGVYAAQNCQSWADKIGLANKAASTAVTPTNIWQLSNRTRCKVIRRLKIGCAKCGWNLAICDIHHWMPKYFVFRDEHKYLSYLCPNCHRLAHSGKLKVEDVQSLKDQIGDEWIDVCYR